MLITIIVIVGLSLLIVGHELGHFGVAKFFKMRVDEFGIGFPPRLWAKKKRETEYSFNWLPFGGFVKIAGEDPEKAEEQVASGQVASSEKDCLFSFRPAWQRFLVIVAGVVANFILGWWLLSIALMIGTPSAVVVAGVDAGSPAAQAGIAAGDVIKEFRTAEEFINYVNQNKGKAIELQALKGSGEKVIRVTPRENPPPGEGAIGVQLAEAGEAPHGFFSALWEGLMRAGLIIGLTFQAVWEMLRSLVMQGSVSADVVGPLGIVSVAQRTSEIGFAYLLQLLSLISLNLAVINLIPFPALDGGRLLLIFVEKIKGSPIPRRVEGFINGIGFVLLLILMVVVTVRDVIRLF
ncbi:MAG: site-2 protease family protein [Candidatus Liptonbacteria bacterium]|nr:site-2 protease family protein [Candidatus Liptonbacteria bacterium]